MSEGIRASLTRQYALFTGALLLACAPPDARSAANASADSAATVLPGVDVLLRDSLSLLQNQRTGLITNHTGLTRDGRTSIDALAAAPGVSLVALFAPEHGIRGQAAPGERVDSSRDSITGLPIRSLYAETRKPTPEMLTDIDVLLFDIQDIGTRYYTYVWTMALAMQAAAQNAKRFIVLDRPNAIGGEAVQGNVLDSAYSSFVGLYPVPMRHGMTAGELARMINAEYNLGADLVVIPAEGWRRSQWFDDTGLPWVAPSPNMPDIESAAHYPGTCLFEGTNLSVGRGTDRPFQQIGAPWLDPDQVLAELSARSLPGVRIESVQFTPQAAADDKHNGTPVKGLRFQVTDRNTYDPAHTAVATLLAIRKVHGDSLTFRDAGFDRLAGGDQLRRAVLAGESLESITGAWRAAREAFLVRRARYLIYP
jgi:uncharacterized protein YbbC (DUF1343 family)